MTEKEKMLAGALYCPEDAELKALRQKAHRLSMEYNQTAETEAERREAILAELVPERGKNVYLQGPVQFDYGVFTSIGENSYVNFNFTVLDCAQVKIGKNVLWGRTCRSTRRCTRCTRTTGIPSRSATGSPIWRRRSRSRSGITAGSPGT